MKGVVFDIQRFSTNDGPGIRTTVFFKGCPLRCVWCHNPESYSTKKQLHYVKNKCRMCGLCGQICKRSVHSFENADHIVHFENCELCGECVDICCHYAVSILGEYYSVEQLTKQILIDQSYYGREGGVTLSGGEPMLQFDFVMQLVKALKKEGVTICMETSGYAPVNCFSEIMPYIDLFLFDYKATSPEEHKQFTGVDNKSILDNLDYLYNAGNKIILRCPLIQGVNDSEDHLNGIAQMNARYPDLQGVEVMAYHNLGTSKLEQTGQTPLLDIKTSDTAQKDTWIKALHALGCQKAKIG